MSNFVRFLRDGSGATAIEYGLIAAGISVAIITVVASLGSSLSTTFTSVQTALQVIRRLHRTVQRLSSERSCPPGACLGGRSATLLTLLTEPQGAARLSIRGVVRSVAVARHRA